jgi:hypothetical protein
MKNSRDTVAVLGQRGTRVALAGLCLAALSATTGATLFAAESQRSSTVEGGPIGQSAGVEVDVQTSEADLASPGGALYNPFGTAIEVTAQTPQAHAMPARRSTDEGSPDLLAATVAAFAAAGALAVLVRVLTAS